MPTPQPPPTPADRERLARDLKRALTRWAKLTEAGDPRREAELIRELVELGAELSLQVKGQRPGNVRRLREAGLTVAEVAEVIGVNVSRVYQILHGLSGGTAPRDED